MTTTAHKWTDVWCKRCGAEVVPSHLTGSRLFYNIEVLSERHLCADCVLDLMSTDPTCEDVMQYITRTGTDGLTGGDVREMEAHNERREEPR